MQGLTQVRYLAKLIMDTGSKRRGQVEWVSHQRARELVDARLCTLVTDEAPRVDSTGPTEKKTAFGTEPDGPSTGLPKSGEPGKAAQSLSSLAVRALRLIKFPGWPIDAPRIPRP